MRGRHWDVPVNDDVGITCLLEIVVLGRGRPDKDWLITLAGETRYLFDLPARSRLSAIFCAKDEMAMACMHEVAAGIVGIPEDVSITGFDDVPYAQIIDPLLTTIRQPAPEIGEGVMSRLLRKIEAVRGIGAGLARPRSGGKFPVTPQGQASYKLGCWTEQVPDRSVAFLLWLMIWSNLLCKST